MKIFVLLMIFSQHYLLMDTIGKAIEDREFQGFENISTKRLIVNMEKPLSLSGDFKKESFVKMLKNSMRYFVLENSEWVSKHIWEDYAVQSMNLILKNLKSGDNDYYKFIFFLKRIKGEWKLYYLRGIRL